MERGEIILECPCCGNDNGDQLIPIVDTENEYYCENCDSEFIVV